MIVRSTHDPRRHIHRPADIARGAKCLRCLRESLKQKNKERKCEKGRKLILSPRAQETSETLCSSRHPASGVNRRQSETLFLLCDVYPINLETVGDTFNAAVVLPCNRAALPPHHYGRIAHATRST